MDSTRAPTCHLLEPLTTNEEKVLYALAQGLSDKEIGLELHIAPITVRGYHKQNIYDKFGLEPGFRNRQWAVHCARELGLLPALSEEQDLEPPGDNPYKGLDAFQHTDAHLFFGREVFIEKLVARMCEPITARFLAVVGPSGSGKSSIVRAGLIPALKQEQGLSASHWAIATMYPRMNPFFELEVALHNLSTKAHLKLLDILERDAFGLNRAVSLVLPERQPLLLVIDQFEELFTLVEDTRLARRFMDLIYAAATDPHSVVYTVITLRADFLDRPLMYPDISWLIQECTAMVGPLSPEELERAITQPAQQAHVSIEPSVVAQMVADANDQPGALPLLEFALTELYDQRIGRAITLDTYGEVGGLRQALAAHADRVYEDLKTSEQEATRQLFLRLITLGEGTEDIRRRVPVHELASLAVPAETMQYVTHFLAANRLLTLDSDPTSRAPTVEVAHEALIREWGRLRTWLDESRDDVRMQRLLATAVEEWQRHTQEESYLMRGAKLAQYEGWRDTTDMALTRQENHFLEASITERDRLQQQKRAIRKLAFVTVVLAALVLGTLALWANHQRGRAEDARAASEHNAQIAQREATVNESLVLANRAQQASEIGLHDLALALALEAVNLDDPPAEAEQTLREIALGLGTRAYLTGHHDSVHAVAVSPIDQIALSGSCAELNANNICVKGELILWNIGGKADETNMLRRLDGHTNWVNSIAFSPNKPIAVSGSSDGTMIVWNMDRPSPSFGEPIHRLQGHDGGVASVAFSPDGHTVLSGSDDHTLILWRVDTGAMLHQFEGHTGGITSVVFSPDGKAVFSSSKDRTIQLWDLETGAEIQRFEGPDAMTTGLVILPGGDEGMYTILAVSTDMRLREWNVASGQIIRVQSLQDVPPSFAIGPDGRTVLFSEGSLLRIWDAVQWRLTGQIEVDSTIVEYDAGSMVTSYTTSPDGHFMLVGYENGTLGVWNMPLSSEMHRYEGVGMAVSPDGQYLLTGRNDGTAILVNIKTGEEVKRFEGPEGLAGFLAFVPDGRRALIGTSDFMYDRFANSLALWDFEADAMIHRFEGHKYHLRAVAISSDGTMALSGSQQGGSTWGGEEGGGDLILWNLETGEEIRRFNTDKDITSIAFSTDGRHALTVSAFHNNAVLWDVATGKLIRRFELGGSGGFGVVFSPDETSALFATGGDGLVLVDIQTGKILRTFVGHDAWAWSVDISPDGRYVISGDGDGVVILWDFETGKELRRFTGHTSAVPYVAFSPDGQSAFSSSFDNTVIQWQVTKWPLDRLLEWIEDNRYVRDFTCDERAQYRIEPLCE